MDTLFFTLGTLAIIAGSIWKFFDYVEKIASNDARRATASWLQRLSFPSDATSWKAGFVSVFDRLFGEGNFSWKRCYTSAAAFLVMTGLVFLALTAFKIVPRISLTDLTEVWWIILTLVLVSLTVNYLSFAKTRYLLSKAAKRPSKRRDFAIMLFDALATLLFALVAIYGAFWILLTIDEYLLQTQGSKGDVEEIIATLTSLTHALELLPVVMTLSLAICYVPLWFWLFFASGFLIRLFSGGSVVIKRILNINEKPFLSIGVISIVLVTFAFALFSSLRALIR